jgi:hypothetical protein
VRLANVILYPIAFRELWRILDNEPEFEEDLYLSSDLCFRPKFTSVVKVCAGEATAAATHRRSRLSLEYRRADAQAVTTMMSACLSGAHRSDLDAPDGAKTPANKRLFDVRFHKGDRTHTESSRMGAEAP